MGHMVSCCFRRSAGGMFQKLPASVRLVFKPAEPECQYHLSSLWNLTSVLTPCTSSLLTLKYNRLWVLLVYTEQQVPLLTSPPSSHLKSSSERDDFSRQNGICTGQVFSHPEQQQLRPLESHHHVSARSKGGSRRRGRDTCSAG